MQKFLKLATLTGILFLSSAIALATAPTAAETKAINAAIAKISKQASTELKVTDIQPSPVTGVWQVTTDMHVFYVTSDGKYVMVGDLLDPSKDSSEWNLTEQAVRKLRRQVLSTLDVKDMIIYPATGKKLSTITVFTDIDCPYCHKLQHDIKDYTDAGIEVRYLAFPRSGPKTPSFDKAVTVWCAKDRQQAYIDAISGKDLPNQTCGSNVVQQEYELGQRMGVSGTPSIFLENGSLIGGLVDAKRLVKMIKKAKN